MNLEEIIQALRSIINMVVGYRHLILNSADKITGTGSYKYREEDGEDYGVYKFQVVDKKKNKILVYYENILPSGLAEGYEIWVKK